MKIKKGRLTLYLTGAATAIGLAAVVMEELRKAHERAEEKKKPTIKKHIVDFKKKLTRKEKKIAGGKIEWLKGVEKRVTIKKGEARKPEKEGPKTTSQEIRELKREVIDYVTDEMEDKLKEMGVDYSDLVTITDRVSADVSRIINEIDLEKYVKETGLSDETIIRLIKIIRPKLLKELKKG